MQVKRLIAQKADGDHLTLGTDLYSIEIILLTEKWFAAVPEKISSKSMLHQVFEISNHRTTEVTGEHFLLVLRYRPQLLVFQ